MMGARMLSGRRAITPIVAEMLMLLIVVAIMGSILIWATGSAINPAYQGALRERMIIEDIWFKSGGEIELYLRNTGKVDIRVTDIYVNDEPVPLPEDTYFPVSILGKTIRLSYPWTSGEAHKFLIITERGSSFEFHRVAT